MLDPAPAGADSAASSLVASHRRILATAAMLGGTTVLVKLAALARDWLVARRFGAGDELDAFLVAFLIPSYAVVVLTHSFAPAFVPTYIRVSERQGPGAAQRLVGSLMVGGCGIVIVISLVLAAAAQFLLPWVGQGFEASKLALTGSLFYVLAGILVVSGASAIFAAVLNAHERFAVTASASMAIPAGTVAVFWTFQDRWGVYALAGGTLVGFMLESCILAAATARHGLLPWPRWSGLDENLRHVAWQYVPVLMGSSLMTSSLVVDQSMAASLGSGQVSILNYGNKIVALVLGVVAVSLSTVLFPRFSRMIAADQWADLRHTLRSFSVLILIASLPVMILLALLSEPLVRLLFERGAFTAETTSAVSGVQRWYLLQIPFSVLSMLGARLLSAMNGNRILLGIGGVNLLMNVGGNLVFMHWFGVNGIAMSTSLMFLVATLTTFAAIRYRLAEADARRTAPYPPRSAN